MMNLGIVGTSDVSRSSIVTVVDGLFRIDAIASRDCSLARDYARKNSINKAYGCYQFLLDDESIEAVYIALPPALQHEWIEKSLMAGKHVLVEKPAVLLGEQMWKLCNLAKKNNLVLMEGLMISSHPWLNFIKETVCSQKYGRINRSRTTITMQIPQKMEQGYRSKKDLGGGVLIDELPYWIQILQSLYDEEALNNAKIEGYNLVLKHKVPWTAEITINIANTQHFFFTSYNSQYYADLELSFDNAVLRVKNFFRPSMGTYKLKVEINGPDAKDIIIFPPQNYYRNQLELFRRKIETPKLVDYLEMVNRITLMEKIICLKRDFDEI